MIELKEFVAQALTQIIDGIAEAQSHAKDKGAKINPRGLFVSAEGNLTAPKHSANPSRTPQIVDFDLAITVSDARTQRAGIGIFVADVGIGGQAKDESGTITLSRLKFSIPVLFPEQA